MFRGETECTLDDKGRLLIPIRYREELGEVVTLARGTYGQINVYPKTLYDEMLKAAQLSEENGEFPNATRLLAAGVECEVDRQGRIVIPSLLRRSARLNSDVVVVGNIDHLEIWNTDRWLESYDNWVRQFQEFGDDLGKMRRAGIRL